MALSSFCSSIGKEEAGELGNWQGEERNRFKDEKKSSQCPPHPLFFSSLVAKTLTQIVRHIHADYVGRTAVPPSSRSTGRRSCTNTSGCHRLREEDVPKIEQERTPTRKAGEEQGSGGEKDDERTDGR